VAARGSPDAAWTWICSDTASASFAAMARSLGASPDGAEPPPHAAIKAAVVAANSHRRRRVHAE
jgi:hypothetical protein